MIRTILVDDECLILDELKELIVRNYEIEIVGTYQNPLDALAEIDRTRPDCAFLDIEMTEMSGIDLAEQMISANPNMEIVFVTAYNNYAAQAYDVNAMDYLLKPIRPERLKKTVDKIAASIGISHPNIPKVCRIKCFGAFEVQVGDQSLKWGRSKSKEFLAYMLQNEGRWISKYRLCDELQFDEYQDQALAYLQMAVYTLRKNLKAIDCNQLEIKYADERYILYVKDADWDLKRLESAADRYHHTGSHKDLLDIQNICREDYLEGEDWLWADLQREVYHCRYESYLLK